MENICDVCGNKFESPKKKKYCSYKCAKRAYRRNNVKPKMERHTYKTITFDELVKELNEYNATHGTNLSYGQYKAKVYMEEQRKK